MDHPLPYQSFHKRVYSRLCWGLNPATLCLLHVSVLHVPLSGRINYKNLPRYNVAYHERSFALINTKYSCTNAKIRIKAVVLNRCFQICCFTLKSHAFDLKIKLVSIHLTVKDMTNYPIHLYSGSECVSCDRLRCRTSRRQSADNQGLFSNKIYLLV